MLLYFLIGTSIESDLKIEENSEIMKKIVSEGMKKDSHYLNQVIDASFNLISKNKNDNIEKIQNYTNNQLNVIHNLLKDLNNDKCSEIIEQMQVKLLNDNGINNRN